MLRSIVVSSTLVVRAAFALSVPLAQPRALSTVAGMRELGSVLSREAGVVVVRGDVVSGEISLVGARTRFSDGSEGTVVVERASLSIGTVDELDATFAVDSSVQIVRNDSRLPVSASLVMGRDVDSRMGGLGEAGVAVFGQGLEQSDMASIDEHLRTGFGAIDVLTPLGRGQSALLVGSKESLSARRRLALCAVASQPKDLVCIYAALDAATKAEVEQLIVEGERRPDSFVTAQPRSSELAADVEAAYTAHAAIALADELRTEGKDVLVVVDGLNSLARLWRSSTAMMVEQATYPLDAATDEAECRNFFSALLQRQLGQSKKTKGSVTVLALCSDEDEDDEEQEVTASYSLEDFELVGTRESIMSRLRALTSRGVELTPAILEKIGVAQPQQKGSSKRRISSRSPMLEMLTSIADAHIEVAPMDSEGRVQVDVAQSLQRVGVGGAETKGGDPRCAAMKALGVGHSLRLELLAALADVSVDEAGAGAKRRADAWSAAFLAQPTPKPLSELVVLVAAIRAGLADGETANLIEKALEAVKSEAPDLLTEVDRTMDLSKAQAKQLNDIIAAAF